MSTERVQTETVEFDVRTDEMLINMGPQHPSTHGVLRLVLRTDGEVVTEVTPHIGYLHRCGEKIGENLTPRQFMPYTDRLDYLAGMNMNLGWALCVEKLLGYEVSEKTRHLRVIIAELSRIASHLVAAGCYGLDLGSFTPFMWTFREREKILNLFEEVCGARLTYSYITVGGVTADLPAGLAGEVRGVPRPVRAGDRRVARPVDQQRDFHPPHGRHRRAAGGDGHRLRLHRPGAARQRRRLGPPPRRRADLHRDVRRLHVRGHRRDRRPLSAGPSLSARAARGRAGRLVGTASTCGCWKWCSRWSWSGKAMEKYAQAAGEVDEPIEVKKKLPKGEAYLETEAPKGQMGFMIISDGSPVPWRVRIRSSSFCNLSVMPELCRGCWWPTCRRSSARWIWCWGRLIGRGEGLGIRD